MPVAPRVVAASLTPTRRLRALDVSRGVAMLCVCLAHFVHVAIDVIGPWPAFLAMQAMSMIASPAFMLFSGMTLGYTFASAPQRFERFAIRLRERGLLLLTVVHALLIPAHVLRTSTPAGAIRTLFITDTIGVAILLGPAVVRRTHPRARVLFGAGLIALSWIVLFSVPTSGSAVARAVLDALFGTIGHGWWEYAFPVVPWFGVYLIGSVIGEGLVAGDARSPPLSDNRRWLSRWALVALGLALLAKLAAAAGALSPASARLRVAFDFLGDPFGKLPPSPVYYLGYGGLALVLARVAFGAVERDLVPWLLDRLAEIGEASLFVFVLQYYVYYVVEMRWPPAYPRLWPLYFLASLLVVAGAAHLWVRWRGNRLLRLPFVSSAGAAVRGTRSFTA